jgi:hypothetical protein
MAVEVARIDVAELARDLEARKNDNQRATLILGSRAGGLFRSDYFYDTMKQFSMRDFGNLSPREQFSECYSVLNKGQMSKTDIEVIIGNALHGLRYLTADECVAELAQQGLFKDVFSTNVDDFLEGAFSSIGMKESHDFVTFFPERYPNVENIVYHVKRTACKIIKLYGDLSTLAFNFARHQVHTESSIIMKSLLGKMLTKEVLVIGLDPVWDEGVLVAFPSHVKTIWLVNEDESVKDILLSQNLGVERIRFVAGGEGSYERFLMSLYWHINKGIPRNFEQILNIAHNQRAILTDLQYLKEICQDIPTLKDTIVKLLKDLNK